MEDTELNRLRPTQFIVYMGCYDHLPIDEMNCILLIDKERPLAAILWCKAVHGYTRISLTVLLSVQKWLTLWFTGVTRRRPPTSHFRAIT